MCKYCERRTDVKLGWDQPNFRGTTTRTSQETYPGI